MSLWGFVDDATFLTKAGHVGVVYRLRGIDYEGLTHAQSAAIVHRFEAALRLLDEHWRVYQYVVKRTIPPVSAATCSQPVANEAIQERVSYLNGRRSRTVRGPSVRRPPLRAAHKRTHQHIDPRSVAIAPRRPSELAVASPSPAPS